MSKGWNAERRARQAVMIQNWKPWQQSTGPKSERGKRRAANNAYKGGQWRVLREELSQLRKILREHKELMEDFI